MKTIYTTLRNQLGSIRRVYWRGNKINRKNDFADFPETVLLLHGFFQTRNIWEIMERRLRRSGFGVLSLNLGGFLWRYNTRSIHKQSQFVAEKMENICQSYGLKHFHIIGHSMGGLVARQYIQNHGGDMRVKSLITLGSPHHGTPTALIGIPLMAGGLLSTSPMQMLPFSRLIKKMQKEDFPHNIPLSSIFSRHDVICPWWSSVLRLDPQNPNIQNFQIRKIGHSELASNPQIYQLVESQLRHASMQWQTRQSE